MQIPVKKLIKVYFSRKPYIDNHLHIKLNDSPVQLRESQKHLGVTSILISINISRKKFKFVTGWDY